MRADIEAAYKALDSKSQGAINGLKAPGQVKKALEQLESFIGDESVMALAAGKDLAPSLGEQQAMGKAASLAAITNVAKSARLLVLTGKSLYHVQGGGVMNRRTPHGRRIDLADIEDVRVRIGRSAAKMGKTERVLIVDYRHRDRLETDACEVATDAQLDIFAKTLRKRVNDAKVASRGAGSDGGVRAVASVAEEIAKLAQLRDAGVISPDEFEAQKAKVLQS
jgi:hypothetical protein